MDRGEGRERYSEKKGQHELKQMVSKVDLVCVQHSASYHGEYQSDTLKGNLVNLSLYVYGTE